MASLGYAHTSSSTRLDAEKKKTAYVVPKLKMHRVLMNAGCHATQDGILRQQRLILQQGYGGVSPLDEEKGLMFSTREEYKQALDVVECQVCSNPQIAIGYKLVDDEEEFCDEIMGVSELDCCH